MSGSPVLVIEIYFKMTAALKFYLYTTILLVTALDFSYVRSAEVILRPKNVIYDNPNELLKDGKIFLKHIFFHFQFNLIFSQIIKCKTHF